MKLSRCVAVAILGTCLGTSLSGEPWDRHTIDDTSRGADGVRLADINGDGRPDIATGWEEGGVIRVYLHPGKSAARQPWPQVTVGQVRSPEDAVFVDLDRDGALDVVSCCEGKTRTVYFHWSPSDPRAKLTATAWQTEPVSATERLQSWMFALPLDVDGRNGVDLIVGSKGSEGSISWLESPRDSRRVADWRLHPLRKAGWIMSLIAHDMDVDGDLDVLYSDRKGDRRGVGWLENPGPAAARQPDAWRDHPVGGSSHEVMFLDVDRSVAGVPGILAAISPSSLLWFRPQDARDAWSFQKIPLPAGCGTGKSVALGDLDRDGVQDLVFSCENAQGDLSGVRWLRAGPDRTVWTDHEISGAEGVKFDRMELLDLDEDGDLDVLTCEERDQLGVIWYENPHQ